MTLCAAPSHPPHPLLAGKRYARTDELGVPYAVTVDFEVVSNSTVTVRERDTMTQVRKQGHHDTHTHTHSGTP